MGTVVCQLGRYSCTGQRLWRGQGPIGVARIQQDRTGCQYNKMFHETTVVDTCGVVRALCLLDAWDFGAGTPEGRRPSEKTAGAFALALSLPVGLWWCS
jgi:hypothetical protein